LKVDLNTNPLFDVCERWQAQPSKIGVEKGGWPPLLADFGRVEAAIPIKFVSYMVEVNMSLPSFGLFH
jgi:hypothetical protein